jgi:beta-glucanase (GH16 family)
LDSELAYNDAEGEGATFNASTYMLYGRFSVTLKSAKVGGAVTAMILIADDKDEIDYELLGEGNGLNEQVQ